MTWRSSARYFWVYHSSLSLNEPVPKPATPGKPGSATSMFGLLLGAVAGELAADHLDVGVVGPLASRWSPKVSVAQCIPTNPLPDSMASKNAFRPSAEIGGVLVGRPGLGEVAGGLEGEGVPLADLVGVEHPAVLGGDDLEAVLLADLGQDPLGQARACRPCGR